MWKLYWLLFKIKFKSFLYRRFIVPWKFLELAFLLFTNQIVLISAEDVQPKKGVKLKYRALLISKLPLSDTHTYTNYPFL